MIKQKDMTSLIRQNQQLRHQLEVSQLERAASIPNRDNRYNRVDYRRGRGNYHNQTATAAEILSNINTMRSRSYRPLDEARSSQSAFSNYSSLAPNANRSELSPRRFYQNDQRQAFQRGGGETDYDGSNIKHYSTYRVDYDTNIRRSQSANKNNSIRRVQQVIQNMLHLMDVDNSSRLEGQNKESTITNQLYKILSHRYSNFEELYDQMNCLLGKYQKRRKIESFNPSKNQVHQIMSLFCKIMDEIEQSEAEDREFNPYYKSSKNRRQDVEYRNRQGKMSSPLQDKQQEQLISEKRRLNKITVGVSPRNSSPRQSVTQRIHGQQNFPNQNQSQIIQSPSRSMSHWDSPFKGQIVSEMDQDEENTHKRITGSKAPQGDRRFEQVKQSNRGVKNKNLTNISQSDLSRQLSVAMKTPDKQKQQQQQGNIIQNFPDSQYNTVSSIEQSQGQIIRGGAITQNDKNILIGNGMTLAELKDLLKKEVIAQIIQQQQHNNSGQQQIQGYKHIPQQFHNLQGQSGEISFHSSFNFDSQNQGIRAANIPLTQRDTSRKIQTKNSSTADDQRQNSYMYSSSRKFADQLSIDQNQLAAQQSQQRNENRILDSKFGKEIRVHSQHSGSNQQQQQTNPYKRKFKRQSLQNVDCEQVIEVTNINNQQNNIVATPSSSSTEQARTLINVRTRSELSNNQSQDGQQYKNVEYEEFDADLIAASGGLDTPDYGQNKAQNNGSQVHTIGREQISGDVFSSSQGGVGTFIPGSRLQQFDSNSQQSLDLALSGILGSINPGGIRSNQQLQHQFKSEVSVISEKSQSVNTFHGYGGAGGKFQSSDQQQHKFEEMQLQHQQQQFSDLGTGQGGTFNTADFNSFTGSNQKYMSSGQEVQNNTQVQKTQELPPDDSLFTISQSQVTPKNYSQSGPNAPNYNKNSQTIGTIGRGADTSKLTPSQLSQSNVVKNIDFAGVSTSNISRHQDDSPQPIQPDSGTASMLLPHMAQGSLNDSEAPSQDSYISSSAQMHIMALRVGSPPPPRKDDQLERTLSPRVSSKRKLELIAKSQEEQAEQRINEQRIIEATQGVKIASTEYDRKKRPQMLLQDNWEMPDEAEFQGSLQKKQYSSQVNSAKQQRADQLDQIISSSFRKEIEKNFEFGQKSKTPLASKFITPKEQDDTLMVSADTISPISVGGIVTPSQQNKWQRGTLQKQQYKEEDDDDNGQVPKNQQRLAGYSGGAGNKTAIFYQQNDNIGRSQLISNQNRISRQNSQRLNSPRYFIKQQSSENNIQQSLSDDFQLLRDIKKEDWPPNFYLQKTSHESFSDDASFNHMQNVGSAGGLNKIFRTPQGVHDVTPLMSSIADVKSLKSNAVIQQGAAEDQQGTPLRSKSKVSEFNQKDRHTFSNKRQKRQKNNQQRFQKAKKDAQKAYRHFSPRKQGEQDNMGKFQNVDDIFQVANLRESGGSKMHISKNLMKKNVQRVSEAKARLSFSNQGAIRHSNSLSSQN